MTAGRRTALAIAGVGALIATAACSDSYGPAARSPATGAPSATASASPDISSGTTVIFTTAEGDEVELAVELADTPEERALGLMNRESLGKESGMLFVWPEETSSGFWMRNTLIPLSIAFISREGVITDIQDMEPLDETLHYAPLPYVYAVEVNQGWYGDNGIGVGDDMALHNISALDLSTRRPLQSHVQSHP